MGKAQLAASGWTAGHVPGIEGSTNVMSASSALEAGLFQLGRGERHVLTGAVRYGVAAAVSLWDAPDDLFDIVTFLDLCEPPVAEGNY